MLQVSAKNSHIIPIQSSWYSCISFTINYIGNRLSGQVEHSLNCPKHKVVTMATVHFMFCQNNTGEYESNPLFPSS